jgi:gamma-glutamylcysteine synthetase
MGEVVEEAVRRLRIQQLSERCYCHLLTEEAAAEAEAAGNWEVEEAAAARTSVPTAFLKQNVSINTWINISPNLTSSGWCW